MPLLSCVFIEGFNWCFGWVANEIISLPTSQRFFCYSQLFINWQLITIHMLNTHFCLSLHEFPFGLNFVWWCFFRNGMMMYVCIFYPSSVVEPRLASCKFLLDRTTQATLGSVLQDWRYCTLQNFLCNWSLSKSCSVLFLGKISDREQ